MFDILSHQQKCTSKQLWDYILYLSEWLKSKTEVITHAREDMEEGEYSSIADESTNLYSHFGNQYDNFSENFTIDLP